MENEYIRPEEIFVQPSSLTFLEKVKKFLKPVEWLILGYIEWSNVFFGIIALVLLFSSYQKITIPVLFFWLFSLWILEKIYKDERFFGG